MVIRESHVGLYFIFVDKSDNKLFSTFTVKSRNSVMLSRHA